MIRSNDYALNKACDKQLNILKTAKEIVLFVNNRWEFRQNGNR